LFIYWSKNNILGSGDDSYGVRYSSNNGDNWLYIKQGMEADSITCFAKYKDGILAGSLGYGVILLHQWTQHGAK